MLTIDKNELSKAVRLASRFTNPRSPAENAKLLKLVSDGNKLSILASCVYGSCSVSIPSDNAIEATVNADTMSRTIGLLDSQDAILELDGNRLLVKGGRSSISLPCFENWTKPDVSRVVATAQVNPEEFARCLEAANSVRLNTEVMFADGIRIHTEDGQLHFSSGLSQAHSWSWCPYEGEDIDVLVTRQAVSPLIQLVRQNESLVVTARESQLQVMGDSGFAIVPMEYTGKPPKSFKFSKPHITSGVKWSLPRQDLETFCRQAAVFVTDEASGVTLTPSEEGLVCRFSGVADGTHSLDFSVDANCHTVIPGRYEGNPVLASNRLLLPAAMAIQEDEIDVYTTDRSLAIIGESGAVAMGLMAMVKRGQ